MKIKFCFFLNLLFLHSILCGQVQPVYLDQDNPLEERVEDALSRMTLPEKVAMCHAQSKFSSPGVPRLGIPEIWTSDGPHGIRAEVFWDEWYNAGWTNDSCIAFPALTCLAATWNLKMSALYGKSIGEEARYRNKNVLLGPGVNIYRTPLNGRNFEYMGEDPYLASAMVVPYIQEVQKNGVAACVKHFALNNQEKDRGHINVQVDDRALHEIYLPPFKAAIQKGKAWAIMGAYNQYKNQHCCHNQYLLKDILKEKWLFDGVVISDWCGVHDTHQAIENGLDMEFGTWTDGMQENIKNAYDLYYLARPYLQALQSGESKEEILNDKVRRILRLIFRTTMAPNRPWGSFGTTEHAQAGRQIAEEGIVLLKNDNSLLPIDFSTVRKIAVIGENAIKQMTIGGGSSSLKVKYEISPPQGLQKQIGNQAEILYSLGYASPQKSSKDPMGEIQQIGVHASREELRQQAIETAQKADLVLFFGGLNKNSFQDSEGRDRQSLSLPYGQDTLIAELAKANPHLAVILISGNAVAMPWIEAVPAIVQAWYGGTEAGNAIAAILTGEVNPSGKLPFTFPVRLEDNAAHACGGYPGDGKNVEYKESLFVGYRYADKQKLSPLFPFGHGLSYTTFSYGKITADKKIIRSDEKITFSIQIKNTGLRAGSEIVQLYISDKKSSLPRPIKELKGFQKIYLQPGEEQILQFTIDKEALCFYDDIQQKWITEPGKFEVLIGASSTNIKDRLTFELK